MKTMNIAWLFPDTLYLHGERGNLLALERFAGLGGFQVRTEKIDFQTENFHPMDYDILFCPPGEVVSFPMILEFLKPVCQELEEFLAAGKPIIATGTSVALWGGRLERVNGEAFDGLGLIDVETREKPEVYGDDLYFTCQYNGKSMEILGNQIQMVNFSSDTEQSFGELIYGYGNTGTDRKEGFRKGNSIFTNTLGPMLVTNPWLTIEIICAAAAAKGVEMEEIHFDDRLERKSFETKKAFIAGKETRLTNCK